MQKLLCFTLAAMLVSVSAALADRDWRGHGCCESMGQQHWTGSKHGPGMGMRPHKPGIRMILAAADEINLTDDQSDKLQKMQVDFRLEKVDLRAQVEKAEIRLTALKHDDQADVKKVEAAIDEVAQMKAELHKMSYRHHKQIRDLLTAEQVKKLKQFHKEKKENWRGPGGRGGHGEHGRGPGGRGCCPGYVPGTGC